MDNDDQINPSHTQIVESFKLLQSIISDTPLNEIIKPIENELGLDPIDDFQSLRDLVADLQSHALLAHKPSIQQLAFIGCDIAHVLTDIATSIPQNKNVPGENESPADHPEGDCSWLQNLGSTIEILIQQPLNQLQEAFHKVLEDLPPPNFPYPLTSLIEGFDQDNVPADEQVIVSELCDRLIQKRLVKERGAALIDITRESGAWPICVPSIADGRNDMIDEYLTSIQLGQAAGIDLGTSSKTGRRRELSPGTSYHLALELFAKLETERTKNHSERYRRMLQKYEDRNEGVTIEKKSQLPKFIKSSTSKPGESHPWHVKNIWMRKAVLLKKISSDNVSAWLDAAMALVASECSGDYENFHWPDNIVDRAITKDQSVEVAAREILKKHLKHLTAE